MLWCTSFGPKLTSKGCSVGEASRFRGLFGTGSSISKAPRFESVPPPKTPLPARLAPSFGPAGRPFLGGSGCGTGGSRMFLPKVVSSFSSIRCGFMASVFSVGCEPSLNENSFGSEGERASLKLSSCASPLNEMLTDCFPGPGFSDPSPATWFKWRLSRWFSELMILLTGFGPGFRGGRCLETSIRSTRL